MGRPCILSAPPEFQRDITVNTLMNADNAGWDEEVLDNLFSEAEVRQIKSIHLSFSRREDGWQWLFDRKGSYSVSRGCKKAHATLRKLDQESTTATG